MECRFNVKGDARKKLVLALEEQLHTPISYKGAPTFAYEVGDYTIDREGTVTGPELSLGMQVALLEKGFEPTINQASIVFNTARAMVEQCGDLAQLSKLVPSTKRIVFPHTNSFYRVLSSETKSKQGFNVSGLIIDELFAQQTRDLFDTMTKYTGDARRQPLYFLITTAGRDKTSICYEIHCKAKAVLDGTKIDPAFYPAVFGIQDAREGKLDIIVTKAVITKGQFLQASCVCTFPLHISPQFRPHHSKP